MARNPLQGGPSDMPDAGAMLATLTQRWAMLRDVASLDAPHEELQQASLRGELVARQRCKLHEADGPRWFEPGDPLPPLDPQHALLDPDRHLVTTKARWQAKLEYGRLSGYLQGGTDTVQARLRQATAAHNAATAEVARLEAALAEARKTLRKAVAERNTVEAELRTFVERAPA